MFALSFALLAVALAPAPTVASVLPSDRVGDIAVGKAALAKKAPNVAMEAGQLLAEDGRVLWSRHADDKRAMASVTKIMTAVVVLEHLKLDDTLTVPQAALAIGESDAKLRAGERLTVREALEALLVKSGNDAAIALALRTSKNENAFVELMNAKANELGLAHTKYANSYGLDEPGHYTTAEDVATLTRYAMTYPDFRRIVALRSTRIGSGSRERTLKTSNTLLGTYRGANGVKTGWTSDAGYCLSASANRAGQEFVAVVLGAATESTRFEQAAELLDWGFANYRAKQLVTAGASVGTATVTDYDDRFVRVLAAEDASRSVFAFDGPITAKARFDRTIEAPVREGQRLGTLEVNQGDRRLASVPLVADRTVPAPGFFERIQVALRRLWRRIVD